MIIIPWVYSVDGGTPPTYTWSGVNTLNQHASAISLPSTCAVTQLKVYAAGNGSSVSTRFAIWNAGGSVLQQSSTFSMGSGTQTPGGQDWHTKTITPKYLSSGTYWVGLYRNPTGGHIAGTVSSGQNAYRKTNTSSFPSISTMSGYSTHSGREMYVGAFYITSPDAPSSCSVSRNSDTSQTITWTRNSSSDQPYDNQYLYRYDNVTLSYYLKATLSGSATSYTDTSTQANRHYIYKIRAKNTVGYSSYSNTDDINTTPAKPSSVEAVRVGTTVEINWEDEARNEDNFTIQRKTSTDGISWGSYSTLSSSIASNSESYTDNSPANYNQYRVKSTTTTPNALSSDYVESNIVQILVYPNPPTNIEPVNYEAIDIDGPIPISWTHNPQDGSEQTYVSIRFREEGEAWSLYLNKYSTSEGSINISTSSFSVGRWEYEVRTWGAATTGGESSDGSSYYEGSGYTLGSFTLSTPPEGTITTPNGIDDYTYSSLTIEWSYSQDESNVQVQYVASLYDENDILLETRQGSNDATTTTFITRLSDATNYKVSLSVKESTGLWSELDETEFTTDFYVPATPTISIEEGQDGTSVITIDNPSPEGDEVATEYNVLYRSVDGGITYEIVQDEIETNTAITDYIPLINGTTYYYVDAISATPSIASSSVDSITISNTGTFYFNTGSNYEDYLKIIGDTSLNERLGIDTTVNKYEGRTYPVEYKGTLEHQNISFSGDLLIDNYDDALTILNSNSNIFYRDWLGRWFPISIVDGNIRKKDNEAYQLSITFNRIEVE